MSSDPNLADSSDLLHRRIRDLLRRAGRRLGAGENPLTDGFYAENEVTEEEAAGLFSCMACACLTFAVLDAPHSLMAYGLAVCKEPGISEILAASIRLAAKLSLSELGVRRGTVAEYAFFGSHLPPEEVSIEIAQEIHEAMIARVSGPAEDGGPGTASPHGVDSSLFDVTGYCSAIAVECLSLDQQTPFPDRDELAHRMAGALRDFHSYKLHRRLVYGAADGHFPAGRLAELYDDAASIHAGLSKVPDGFVADKGAEGRQYFYAFSTPLLRLAPPLRGN